MDVSEEQLLVAVLPLTKKAGKRREVFPFEVRLPAKTAGNKLDSIIMPQQIRTISKTRLMRAVRRMIVRGALAVIFIAASAAAQTINIWPGVAPGSEKWTQKEMTIPNTPVGTVAR